MVDEDTALVQQRRLSKKLATWALRLPFNLHMCAMVETTQVNEGSNLAFQTISSKRKLLHKILKAIQDLMTI